MNKELSSTLCCLLRCGAWHAITRLFPKSFGLRWTSSVQAVSLVNNRSKSYIELTAGCKFVGRRVRKNLDHARQNAGNCDDCNPPTAC